jgi:hypothetical protein
MLVSSIRCKICWKARVWESFTRILRREGWEINDLSPLSWQFFWNFMTFGWFQRLRVLKQIFVSRKLKYLNFWYHEMFVFLNHCLSQKTFYCRKLVVFSCLQFADCYIWSRILSCGVILCFNHLLRNLLKSFLKEIMVLSKTCVRFRNCIFKRFE